MITVFCDTETGGTQPQHPTIQLAAIATDGDVELDAFSQRIAFNPLECDPDALAMNHYDPALWIETAVMPNVCAARFARWLRPYQAVTLTSKRTGNPYTVARMAGYNTPFDQPRLNALFNGSFVPCEFLWRDVLQRALFYCDEHGVTLENYKLTTVAAHFGIDISGAHDALTDVRLTWHIYSRIKADAAAKRTA